MKVIYALIVSNVSKKKRYNQITLITTTTFIWFSSIYMGDSQENYPDQIFTLFIAKDSVFTFLNVVCRHFTFFQLTYIQTGILILIFAA